jgi:hypothetical protein
LTSLLKTKHVGAELIINTSCTIHATQRLNPTTNISHFPDYVSQPFRQ